MIRHCIFLGLLFHLIETLYIPAKAKESSYLKHIGIYSFYAGSLKEYVANGECKLEKLEKLEQLRWLWMGKK